ncbi:uncharacterized protein LOC134695977 isoform X1 [Mytilus trossulus]|uniref:uncharacterized protein LOC134695977 isoform X1 n=1 Tax=Mytilus trossulus TaxID=6551 RepID=UPI003003BB9B
MEFLVIYFAFDNAFEAVNMSKVECDKTEAEMVKGTKCQVPFETESISEDGKDTVETKLYDGIILCSGQVKKKAEELANQCQKKLTDGLPVQTLFKDFQANTKRNASSKLTEAIKELQDEEPCPSEKKKVKKDKVSTKSTIKSKKVHVATSNGSAKPAKKSTDTCKATAVKSALHPDKMAEISAMLNIEQSQGKEDLNLVKVMSSTTCTSTPKRQDICSPKKTVTSMYEDISPVKQTVTIDPISIASLRRSPRKHCSSVLFTHKLDDAVQIHVPKENISTIGQSTDKWDGVFVDSVNSIYDMDKKEVHELHSNFGKETDEFEKLNNDHDMPTDSSQEQTKKELICNLLGITKEEAATTSMVLGRLSKILGGHDFISSNNTPFKPPSMPSIFNNDPDEINEPDVSSIINTENDSIVDMSTEEQDNSQSTWSSKDSCNVSQNSSNACSEAESSNSRIRGSKPDDKQLTVLIKDSLDPNKFKDVLVVKTEERHARLQAKSSKRPAIALLNAILTCVFTKAELAVSSGLGIRKMKGEVGCPLDGTKIEAIREYIMYHCTREGWQLPSKVEFNTTITNKVTNCRRKLLTHPVLKKKSC